jgi:hypothetical protein
VAQLASTGRGECRFVATMRWLDATPPRRAAPKGHETFISRAASFSHRLLPTATLIRAHGAKCQQLKTRVVSPEMKTSPT